MNFLKLNKNELIAIIVLLFIVFGYNSYNICGDAGRDLRTMQWMKGWFLGVDIPQEAHVRQSGHAFYYFIPFVISSYLKTIPPLDFNFNGTTLMHVAIYLADNLLMAICLLMVIRLIKSLGLPGPAWAGLTMVFCTSAFSVTILFALTNHTVDTFLYCLAVWLLWRGFLSDFSNRWDIFALGAIMPCLFLVRYFNFAPALVIGIYFLFTRRYKPFLWYVLGGLAMSWLPLMFFAWLNHDPFLLTGSFGLLGGSGGFRAHTVVTRIPKYLGKILLHPFHGLYVWSPVTFLGTLGLLFYPKHRGFLNLLLLVAFSIIAAYGFYSVYYAAWSFSNRFLTGLLPIFSIGIACFWVEFGRTGKVLTIGAAAYSLVLFVHWHLNYIHGDWGTPADILTVWQQGQGYTGKPISFGEVVMQLLEYCRYKHVVYFFLH
jgi:hypothetical protein